MRSQRRTRKFCFFETLYTVLTPYSQGQLKNYEMHVTSRCQAEPSIVKMELVLSHVWRWRRRWVLLHTLTCRESPVRYLFRVRKSAIRWAALHSCRFPWLKRKCIDYPASSYPERSPSNSLISSEWCRTGHACCVSILLLLLPWASVSLSYQRYDSWLIFIHRLYLYMYTHIYLSIYLIGVCVCQRLA